MSVDEILEQLDALTVKLSVEYKKKLRSTYEELIARADLGVNSAMLVAKHVSTSVQKFQEELDSLLAEYSEDINNQSPSDEDLEQVSERAQEEVKSNFSSIFEKAYYKLKELLNIK